MNIDELVAQLTGLQDSKKAIVEQQRQDLERDKNAQVDIINTGTALAKEEADVKNTKGLIDVADAEAMRNNFLGGQSSLDRIASITTGLLSNLERDLAETEDARVKYDETRVKTEEGEFFWRDLGRKLIGKPTLADEAHHHMNREVREDKFHADQLNTVQFALSKAKQIAADATQVDERRTNDLRNVINRQAVIDSDRADLASESALLEITSNFNAASASLTKEDITNTSNALVQQYNLNATADQRALTQQAKLDAATARNLASVDKAVTAAAVRVDGHSNDLAGFQGELSPDTIAGSTTLRNTYGEYAIAGADYALLRSKDVNAMTPEEQVKYKAEINAANEKVISAKAEFDLEYSRNRELFADATNTYAQQTASFRNDQLAKAKSLYTTLGIDPPTQYSQLESLLKQNKNLAVLFSQYKVGEPESLVAGYDAASFRNNVVMLQQAAGSDAINKLLSPITRDVLSALNEDMLQKAATDPGLQMISASKRSETYWGSQLPTKAVVTAQLNMLSDRITHKSGLAGVFKLTGADFKVLESVPMAQELGVYLDTLGEPLTGENLAAFYRNHVTKLFNESRTVSGTVIKDKTKLTAITQEVKAAATTDMVALLTTVYGGKFAQASSVGLPIDPKPVVYMGTLPAGGAADPKYKKDLSNPLQFMEYIDSFKPGGFLGISLDIDYTKYQEVESFTPR